MKSVRPGGFGSSSNPSALIEGERVGVLLVDVELDAVAVALTGTLERGLDERPPEAGSARRAIDVEVLHPAVAEAAPNAQAVAELADPAGRVALGARGEQVLGGWVVDQPAHGPANDLVIGSSFTSP